MKNRLHALAIAIQTRVPILLEGEPGVAKTAIVNAVGSVVNAPVITVISSLREPTDFLGLPVVRPEGIKLHAPAWALQLVQAGKGCLFLDELSTAPPAVQNAALRVVHERVVGDVTLPDKVSVIAAANKARATNACWTLSAPLANRFCHLDWPKDTSLWHDWMLGVPADYAALTRPLPGRWQREVRKHRSLIVAFTRAFPALAHSEPGEPIGAGGAWPSFRTWDMAATLLAAAEAAQASGDTEAILLSGCVGSSASAQFFSWKRNLDLPDPEFVLGNPSKFQIPKRADQQHALLSAMVSAVAGNLTANRFQAAFRVLSNFARSGFTDVAAASARQLMGMRKKEFPLPSNIEAFAPIMRAAGILR